MTKTIQLMEVCGTHTMAIAKSGIRQMLPKNLRLLSGPGCPVCVTPPEVIDVVLQLCDSSADPIITSYGDMIRVPGSVKGECLLRKKALGKDVRIVYSPMDAVQIAEENPDREVVFLGVGFETSAPGTAAAIKEAKHLGIRNFSVFSMLKMLEPSVKALASEPDFRIDGFIVPGHVAVILGEEGTCFFSEELKFPAVIAGFETEDILKAIARLLQQIRKGEAKLENIYTSVVRPEGNPEAMALIREVLEARTDIWRGLGKIPDSGYGIREAFAAFDAEKKFHLKIQETAVKTACRCGEVICGKIEPAECPMFGRTCVPDDPEGPCMVSSEGACAAAWKYRDLLS